MKHVILMVKNKVLFITRKLSLLASYLNDLAARKELVIMLGQKSTYIAAYRNGKRIKSIPLENAILYNPEIHSNILNDFKSYKTSIIIDHSDASLSHHNVTHTKGTSWNHSIKQFIMKTFKDQLVDYKVYASTNENNKHGSNVVFSSISPNASLQSWIGGVSTVCKNFKSIYSLNLHIPLITHKILQKFNLAQGGVGDIFILVTMTATSGLKVVVTYKNDIMHSELIEYSYDKSREYVKDVLDNEISNCLTIISQVVGMESIQPSIIFFVPHEMQVVLQASSFANTKSIIVPIEHYQITDGLMDGVLLDVLGNKLGEGAKHSMLHKFVARKNLLCRFLKPLQVIILCLLVLLLCNEAKIFKDHYDMRNASYQYFELVEKYNELKKQYPNISDFEELMTFQAANLALHQPQTVPFDHLDKALNILGSSFIVQKIYWKLDEKVDAKSGRTNQVFEILGKYTDHIGQHDMVMLSLKNDILSLERVLPKFAVEYTHDDNNIVSHGDLIYIPVKIIIRQAGE